jgi:acyl-coenzyme A synthetase/AMP-(fatty) acid ligase
VHGYRIELAEVTAALQLLPDVAEAIVLASKDPDGASSLIAYIKPARREDAGDEAAARVIERLRSQLAERLPEFMVPARFVVIDAIPLTASGKRDLEALGRLGQASGRRCSAWSGSASTTISSRSAAIRCAVCRSATGPRSADCASR